MLDPWGNFPDFEDTRMMNDNKIDLVVDGGIEAGSGEHEVAASGTEDEKSFVLTPHTSDDGLSILIAYISQKRNCWLNVIKWQVQIAVS